MVKNRIDLKLGFVLMCVLTIVGIIVHAKIVVVNPVFYPIYESNVYVDFFSYFKAQYLVGVTALAAVVMIYGLIEHKADLKRFRRMEFYLLMAMAGLAILSTVLSKYPVVAYGGSIGRFEGLWVWLAYLTIPFLVIHFIRTKRQLDRYIQMFLVPSFIILLIGTLQYFGYDIFTTDWIESIIFTEYQRLRIQEFSTFTMGVYATLYNQNYVGSFVVLVLPLYIYTLFIALKSKKWHWFVFAIAGVMVSGISLIGAYSSGGYIAVGVSIVFMLVTVLSAIKGKRTKGALALLLIGFLGTVLYIYSTNDRVRADLNFGLTIEETAQTVNKQVTAVEQKREIESIVAQGHEVTVKTSQETIIIRDEDQNLRFMDEQGLDLTLMQLDNSNTFVATDEKYRGYELGFYFESDILELAIDGRKIPILLDPKGLQIAGIRKIPIRPIVADSLGFDGYETFGSYRGYIWSRTLPLMKDSLLLGNGADTFAYRFPQNDIGRFNKTEWITFNTIVDKPHNMYLQSATQFGVVFAIIQIGLMSFLVLSLLNRKHLQLDPLKVAVVGSIFGYAIIGLVNDSVVSVSPYFWLLMGIGFLLIDKNDLTNKETLNGK